jgi:hypothetical protein
MLRSLLASQADYDFVRQGFKLFASVPTQATLSTLDTSYPFSRDIQSTTSCHSWSLLVSAKATLYGQKFEEKRRFFA